MTAEIAPVAADLSIPRDAKCQEASPQSYGFYVPCSKPAIAIVANGDSRPYYMCAGCTFHNVNNRGGRVIRQIDRLPDWKPGRAGSVVSEEPFTNAPGGYDAVDYYGGYLVAESVAPQHRPLISAAPDMLEALRMVRDADDDQMRDGVPGMPSAARQRIDAAIAKAEGRS